MKEFVRLRSKTHNFLKDNDGEDKMAIGIESVS